MAKTSYVVCYSPVGWNDPQAVYLARPQTGCGHRHRTVETAARCDDKINRAVRRYNGPGTYLDTRVLATTEDGYYRPLTDSERDVYYEEVLR